MSIKLKLKKEIKMLRHLIIANNSGVALFHHSFCDKKLFDIQLISGYFDLLCRFSKSEMKASLKSFTVGKKRVIFYAHDSDIHIIFICKDVKYDEKSLLIFARRLIEDFLKSYKSELRDFNGQISIFRPFSKKVEELATIDLYGRDASKSPE